MALPILSWDTVPCPVDIHSEFTGEAGLQRSVNPEGKKPTSSAGLGGWSGVKHAKCISFPCETDPLTAHGTEGDRPSYSSWN